MEAVNLVCCSSPVFQELTQIMVDLSSSPIFVLVALLGALYDLWILLCLLTVFVRSGKAVDLLCA